MGSDDVVIEDAIKDVIFPPPDKKKWIDKAAEYVQKHGEPFIMKMLQKDAKKFDFVIEGHAYYPYYKLKVKMLKEGNTDDLTPVVPQAIVEMQKMEETKAKLKQQTLALTSGGEDQEIRPPAADVFTVFYPLAPNLDIEIIKISAQFTALNGEPFLVGLSQREGSNPQFDFLRPTHALHNYFCQMVEAYRKSILPPSEAVSRVRTIANGLGAIQSSYEGSASDPVPLTRGQQSFLDRCKSRYAFESRVLDDEETKQKLEAAERKQLEGIDWQTFTVVETLLVDMQHDRVVADLPPPRDFKALREQRENKTTQLIQRALKEEAWRQETGAKEAREAAAAALKGGKQEMEEGIVGYAEDGIPILAAKRQRGDTGAHAHDSAGFVTCPITGQKVKADALSEHLRVVLLAPEWKAQKEMLVARARDAGAALASDRDMADNLAAFMRKKPEFFGDLDAKFEQELAKRQKA